MRSSKHMLAILIKLIPLFVVSLAPHAIPSAAAELLLASQDPPAIFTDPFSSSTHRTPGNNSLSKSNRPFLRFETEEKQFRVIPTIQLGKGQGAQLAERERERKKKELLELTKNSMDLSEKIKTEKTRGIEAFLSQRELSNNSERSTQPAGLLNAPHSKGPSSFQSDATSVGGTAQFITPRTELFKLVTSLKDKLQDHNRKNSELSLTDSLATAIADPTFAVAVGIDTVGGFFKFYFNHAAKITDEMIRTWDCASKGMGADRSCTRPTSFKDYWGSLMTGENSHYTAGETAIDVFSATAFPVLVNLGEKVGLAALKKIPESMTKVADTVRAGAERIRTALPSNGFADEAGRLIVRDAQTMANNLSIEAGIAGKTIDVLSLSKGLRPEPSTYLSREYIEKHIAEFDNGATRIMKKSSYDVHGPAREDGTMFVLPKSQADRILAEAKGDRSYIEKALGFQPGALKDSQLVRLDFPRPKNHNIRMPSGNELGANEHWLPGGKLPTGLSEGVMDLGTGPGTSYKRSDIKLQQ